MRDEHLEKIKELFFQYGVKNVTMDMIASELGISKRTLYELVSDKKNLINQTMQYFIKQHRNEMISLFNSEEKAVKVLANITIYAIHLLSKIHPSLIFEIKRYYPESWKLMENFFATFVIEQFSQLLKRGQEEGYFDSHLKPDFIARLHHQCMMTVIDDNYFEGINMDKKERVYHYFYFLIHGICTDEGKKAYHEGISQILS